METNIEGSGFCTKRLENINDYLKRLVDSGQVAGVGALFSSRG
jgi:hypothetical protein